MGRVNVVHAQCRLRRLVALRNVSLFLFLGHWGDTIVVFVYCCRWMRSWLLPALGERCSFHFELREHGCDDGVISCHTDAGVVHLACDLNTS